MNLKNGINKLVQESKKGINDTFMFNGKGAWSGSVNPLDGTIEETHSYDEAKDYDFHHSFYFTDPTLEKMNSGDSLFFFVDKDGNVNIDPMERGDDRPYNERFIIEQIKKQIK